MSDTEEFTNPARYALFKALFLPSKGMSRASADGLIDAYARELAERIRKGYSGDGPDEDNWITNPYDAAALINPSTLPMRPDGEPT